MYLDLRVNKFFKNLEPDIDLKSIRQPYIDLNTLNKVQKRPKCIRRLPFTFVSSGQCNQDQEINLLVLLECRKCLTWKNNKQIFLKELSLNHSRFLLGMFWLAWSVNFVKSANVIRTMHYPSIWNLLHQPVH